MARFFVGDLHFGHAKVAKLRFHEAHEDISAESIVTHHDMLIYNQLQRTLTPKDQLWVLGDISSGKPDDEKRALGFLGSLKRETGASFHLISGNHDSCSSIHRSAFKMQKHFLAVFDSIQDFARMRFEGTQVLFSHYPYARSGDGPGRGEARYAEFRLPDTGMPLVHAHTHYEEPHMPFMYPINETDFIPVGKDLSQLCVSWDARRGPTTEAHINQWIKDWKTSRSK